MALRSDVAARIKKQVRANFFRVLCCGCRRLLLWKAAWTCVHWSSAEAVAIACAVLTEWPWYAGGVLFQRQQPPARPLPVRQS